MSYSIEFKRSEVRFEFECRPQKQQLILDVLLSHGKLDIDAISYVLDIGVDILKDVYKGLRFLCGKDEEGLIQLFLVLVWK